MPVEKRMVLLELSLESDPIGRKVLERSGSLEIPRTVNLFSRNTLTPIVVRSQEIQLNLDQHCSS